MADSGCVHVSFGIESIDEGVLKNIGKGITREQIDNAVKWAKEAGLYVVGNFMIGNIGDDRISIEKSVNYAIENDNIDIPSFTVITPLKNTEVFDIAEKKGWIRSTDWNFYNQKVVNMRNEALDFNDLEEIRDEVRLRIRPKVRAVMSEMENKWLSKKPQMV